MGTEHTAEAFPCSAAVRLVLIPASILSGQALAPTLTYVDPAPHCDQHCARHVLDKTERNYRRVILGSTLLPRFYELRDTLPRKDLWPLTRLTFASSYKA